MKRFTPVILIILLLASCRKSESDFIWEKSYGKGEAYFVRTSSDSGLIACGEKEGKPYFIRLEKTHKLNIDFSGETQGLFSSAWFDTSGYITGGNSEGKMLLMRHSKEGNLLWEKSLDAGFNVDFTRLFYSGDGSFLAIGTASADSSGSGATGLLFVRFDTTGQILTDEKLTETSFIAANGASVDNEGNIYLAVTRKSAVSKPKASVAKFNNLFQKLWETELYNNPDFGAASLSVIVDESGNICVAGKTELSTTGEPLINSYLVSLTNAGSVRWKRYLESSNAGSSLVTDVTGNLMMLNKNCYIINIADPSDGAEAGRIRMFSLCDSYNTDALGEDLDISYDKNILVAGTRGGNFYLALKASQ